jgi:hypothetical protein
MHPAKAGDATASFPILKVMMTAARAICKRKRGRPVAASSGRS